MPDLKLHNYVMVSIQVLLTHIWMVHLLYRASQVPWIFFDADGQPLH